MRKRTRAHKGNTIEDGPGECDETKNSTADDSSLTGTISRPPSACSFRSGCTSLHSHYSHSTRHYYRSKRSSMGSDDLQSDVPTISESIADMQDLQELGMSRTSEYASMSPTSSQTAINRGFTTYGMSSAPTSTMIDCRQHPLAPININPTPSSLDSHVSMNAAIGDLGCCSDVPSVRDDMSVASAHSEICVSFPASLAPSNCESEECFCESPRRKLRISRGRTGAEYGTASNSLLREMEAAGVRHTRSAGRLRRPGGGSQREKEWNAVTGC